MAADPDFELLAPVHMGVVCFRAVRGRRDDMESSAAYCNGLNQSVVKAINATGRAYLTHTVLGPNVAMRIGIGNVLTTEQHLAEVFELIKRELTVPGAAA